MSTSFNWFGDSIEGNMETEIKHSMMEIAGDLQGRSRDEAPVDTGDLRGNCKVDVSDIDSGSVRVGYGLPYAMRQHEELGYNHPKGGKAKYLEDPYNENESKYFDEINEAAKRGMQG